MSINKSFWLLLIFILSGLVIGGLLGEFAGNAGITWLSYGQEFGTIEPLVLDLGLLKLTFGIIFRINITSIIGLLIAVFIYRWVVR